MVVAVAMTLAVQQLVTVRNGSAAFQWSILWALIGFIVTLIPFYHGAERHLEGTYVENDGPEHTAQRLLWDFLVLFTEACVLIAIGALVADPGRMLVALIVLWSIDVIWALVARLLLKSQDEIWTWGTINTVAAALFGLLLILDNTLSLGDVTVGLLIMLASLARTCVDYATGWTFYFPSGLRDAQP